MGLIVTTSARAYYLTCKSVGKSPVRVVRWRYPAEVNPTPTPTKEPGLLPDPTEKKFYHVGYDLQSVNTRVPEWSPRHVIDDGKKLYIIFPEITLFETAPMVRMVGPNGPQLVNARQHLNVTILDQLAPRLELRVGLGDTAEVIAITRGHLKTIACPGDELCPVWPHAAQVLARKGGPVQPPPAAPPAAPPGPPPVPPRSATPPTVPGVPVQTGEVIPTAPAPGAQGETP